MNTIKIYIGIIKDSLLSLPKLFVIHNLTLVESRDEGDGIRTFIFNTNRKHCYKAGQYGIWLLKQWVKGKPFRLFTIASSPEENIIQLSTYVSESAFKKKLIRLKIGDQMWMIGPIGRFILPEKRISKAVFIAGGIGITPVRAMLKHISDNSLNIESTVVHTSRDSHLYMSELKKYADNSFFITRDKIEEILNLVVKNNINATYYISGPPKFVESTRILLKNKKIKRIKTDGFLGY